MSLPKHHLELLSPARDTAIAKEAILHGADAVYIGGPGFGARHNASNSVAEIAELVDLWHNRKRASASVKRIAQKHVDELTQRIEAMQAMQRTLGALLTSCHGDDRPDCPILDDLAGAAGGLPTA